MRDGIEYPAGGRRRIDILAVGADDAYVVIELKVARGYDRAVGQLLRYMGWVKENLCDEGQSVRGVIIASNISEDLRLATERIPDIRLMEYQLSFQLRENEPLEENQIPVANQPGEGRVRINDLIRNWAYQHLESGKNYPRIDLINMFIENLSGNPAQC